MIDHQVLQMIQINRYNQGEKHIRGHNRNFSSVSSDRWSKSVHTPNEDNHGIPKSHRQSVSPSANSSRLKRIEYQQAAQLEEDIMQMQKIIAKQKSDISSLSLEVAEYMKLCDQQKKKLKSIDLTMMKEEYEEQLRTSASENEHIASLIYELTEQESSISIEEDREIDKLKKMQAEFAKQIESVTRERHHIKQEITKADNEHTYNTALIQKQEERIDELRNVQRKLKIAQKQKAAMRKY